MGQCCSQQNSTATGLPQPIPKEKIVANVEDNLCTNGFYSESHSVSSSNKPSFPTSTDSSVSKSPHPRRPRKLSASRLIQTRIRYIDSTSASQVEESGSEAELSKSLVRKSFGYARSFSSKYELGPEVGRGHFGYTCYASVKLNGEFQEPTVAVKIIPKAEMMTSRDMQDVKREVNILKALSGHSNLVQFHEVFEDIDRVYIVMELCTGGELLQQILDRGGRYTEEEAKAIVSQMLSAVAFIHLQGVVHRDLKPENFLFKDKDGWPHMKAIDFGLSDYVRPDERLKDVVGSAYYVAPEVLEQAYGTEADIWSVGVIVYILLSGNRPFWARTESGIFAAVTHTEPDFHEDPWPSISLEAKDFVQKLLKKDPQKRLTAAQSLAHPWLRGSQKVPLDMQALKLVKSYLESSSLRRSALKALAKTLTDDDFYYLGAQFMLLKPEKDGSVTFENFKMALLRYATEAMKESNVRRILKPMQALTSKMYFHEFCAAAVNIHQLELMDNWEDIVKKAYEHFDKKGNRVVSVEELAKEMCVLETVPASTFLHEWVRLDDGKLSLRGFSKVLLSEASLSSCFK
ncbi:hypothetical protein GOP47_0029226 [Adiantum capillus-veneris]|nr:hypothetical protein GOP47_0029226 [Adiantum capillus-veneris]